MSWNRIQNCAYLRKKRYLKRKKRSKYYHLLGGQLKGIDGHNTIKTIDKKYIA